MYKKRLLYIVILILISNPFSLKAQELLFSHQALTPKNNTPTVTEWQKLLNTSFLSNDILLYQTTDGGYISAGQLSQISLYPPNTQNEPNCWVRKYDLKGHLEWQKLFSNNYSNSISSIDQTTDGGYILSWTSSSHLYNESTEIYTNDRNYWIVKLDKYGNTQWQKSFGGSAIDLATTAHQTLDGGFIVGGSSCSKDGTLASNHGKWDFHIIKLDPTGNIEWQRSLGGSDNDTLKNIIQTTDGGYIIAGDSYSSDGDVVSNYGYSDYWVVKVNSKGIIEWEKSLGGSHIDLLSSVHQTLDKGFIIGGQTLSTDGDITSNHGRWDSWIIKLDYNGNMEWQKSLGGSEADYLTSIYQTPNKDYIAFGSSTLQYKDDSGSTKGGFNSWVLRIGTNGNLKRQETLNYSPVDLIRYTQQTSDGGYILLGSSYLEDPTLKPNSSLFYWISKFKLT